jgi:hypothetical protein
MRGRGRGRREKWEEGRKGMGDSLLITASVFLLVQVQSGPRRWVFFELVAFADQVTDKDDLPDEGALLIGQDRLGVGAPGAMRRCVGKARR